MNNNYELIKANYACEIRGEIRKTLCGNEKRYLLKDIKFYFTQKHRIVKPCPGWVAQLVGTSTQKVYQKVAGSIPSQGTYLGCGFDPRLGCLE